MKLDVDTIRNDWSIRDIEKFINKNYNNLTENQIKFLKDRIKEMERDNKLFVENLLKNKIFRLACIHQKVKHKNKIVLRKVLDDMVKIRDFYLKRQKGGN